MSAGAIGLSQPPQAPVYNEVWVLSFIQAIEHQDPWRCDGDIIEIVQLANVLGLICEARVHLVQFGQVTY